MIEKVHGLKELHDFFQTLPAKVEAKLLRGGIRAGAKVVADDARSKAPTLKEADPRRVGGELKKSVRVMSTAVRGGRVMGGVVAGGKVNVKKDKVRGQADAYWAVWVEYGTINMAAQPFMRPAVDARHEDAVGAAAVYMRGRVESGDLK